MFTIFIDGREGTTGLQIHDRLKNRTDISLLAIPAEKRKDGMTRREFLNRADIVILCLPDDAAREAVAMIDNPKTRVIDASTAHRVASGWVYGLPEMVKSQRQMIKTAARISNPGCYATGFVLLVRPLVETGVLAPESPANCFAVSGYSGGGKKLIAEYEVNPVDSAEKLGSRNYALGLDHKHIPEMQKHALLTKPPLFLPVVGAYYNGMNVAVPFHKEQLKTKVDAADLHRILSDYYSGEPFISIKPPDVEKALENGKLNPVRCNGTNQCDLFVFGNGERLVIASRFDNLGKGASGAAVQNLNIMMGVDEHTGLAVM